MQAGLFSSRVFFVDYLRNYLYWITQSICLEDWGARVLKLREYTKGSYRYEKLLCTTTGLYCLNLKHK